MKPKCVKCGGDLGDSFFAFATKVCPKCAGVGDLDKFPEYGAWQSKLIPPHYLTPYIWIDPGEETGSETGAWWAHKTEFVSFPKLSNIHQTIGIPWLPGEIDFDDGYNSDETLAAIGRAFDDAIDLAYLG